MCQEAFDDLRKERDYWRDRAYELFDQLKCWENGTFRRANAKYWDSWTDTHNEIKAMKAEAVGSFWRAEEAKLEAQAEAERKAAARAAEKVERDAAKQAEAERKRSEAERRKAEAREYQREEERMASVAAAITLNRSAAAAKSSNKKVSFHRDVDDWPTMF